MMNASAARNSGELIETIIREHLTSEGPLLPILHAVQKQLGHIPPEAVTTIARQLNTTTADIHGVISFYHFFKTAPSGQHTVQICRAESCQASGGRQLETRIKQTLGIDYHQTTTDDLITLEPVYCLGNCACSPSLRIDDAVYGLMTSSKFEQLLDDLQTVPLEIRT